MLLGLLTWVGPVEAIPPRRLLEVVDFSSPVVSPDGTKVAFRLEQASVERNTYDTIWYVQDMTGVSPPRRVADGGVVLRDSAGLPLAITVVWSPDGDWIYYRASVDGKIDVWRAAADGSGASPVTLDPADVRDFTLSLSGETLRYSVGAAREQILAAEEAEYYRGVHIDETVPVGQSLFRSGNVEGRLATQRYSGIWFDRASLLADVPDHWKKVDLEHGVTSELLQPEVPSDVGADADLTKGIDAAWKLSRSAANGRVAILTRVGERNGLRRQPDVQLSVIGDPRTNHAITCVAELCTNKAITGIKWRPDSDEVLFTVTDPHEGLAQSIFRWNVELNVVHSVVYSRGLINGGRDPSSECGVSSIAMVCVAAEPGRPPQLERIDLQTGARKLLFDPNATLAQDIANSQFVKLLRWKDAKGQVFTGQYYPARRGNIARPPLFISYYKCTGFLRGGLGDEWPFASLAGNGISALCINSAPSLMNAVDRYNNGLSAVESAIELLASEGEVDCARVGFGGLSFGSEVGIWIAMKSKLLSAVSVSSPSVSPNYYLFGSVKGDAFFDGLKGIWGLGGPDETPKRWRVLSPKFNLDKMTVPILLQMPEQEYLQALDYAIPLLRRNHADLYVFPNEPHQKFQPRHKLAVYERNLDWFRFWLLDVEDSSAAKVAQYTRWRAMRDSKLPGPRCKAGPQHLKSDCEPSSRSCTG